MSGKSRRKNAENRKKNKKQVQQPLTDRKLADAIAWKGRIEASVQDALSCHEWMKADGLLKHNHALRALEKHVENTAESIKQLDNLTKGELLATLVEIPEDGADKSAMTWKNLKGIRERLTHKFFDTDYDIIVNAVEDDFPALDQLFSLLGIAAPVLHSWQECGMLVEMAAIPLPTIATDSGERLVPGSSTIIAMYHEKDGWVLFRLFLNKDGTNRIVGPYSKKPLGHGFDIVAFGDNEDGSHWSKRLLPN